MQEIVLQGSAPLVSGNCLPDPSRVSLHERSKGIRSHPPNISPKGLPLGEHAGADEEFLELLGDLFAAFRLDG